MKTAICKTITLLVTLAVCTCAMAQPAAYQVELLIFQRKTPRPPVTDLWVNAPTQLNTADTVQLEPINSNANDFRLLPASDYKLTEEAQALEKSGKYNIILHQAWLEQITSPRKTRNIHIYGGNLYDSGGQIVADQASAAANDFWQVNGILSIAFSRYFEVKTKLLFTVPAIDYPAYAKLEPGSISFTPLISFRMLQSRRMKSDELNYFDHPIFGVLLKVIPLKS